MQHVQNAAARLVTANWKYERGLSRLMHDDLHWLVIPQRVQACCDSPSLSSAPSSKVSHRLLCASLWSCWSPAPAIWQMSSTVSSASLPQHLWDLCIFCRRNKSLELTAWSSVGSSCWPRTTYGDLKMYLFAGHSKLLCNCALLIDIYLLTYNCNWELHSATVSLPDQ